MSPTLWFVVPAAVSALLAFALTPLAARLAEQIGAVDMPGERKVHTHPIPRLGGVAVVAASVVAFAAAPLLSKGRWHLPRELALPMAVGLLPILLVSIVDDIRGVAARWKFAAHVLGATTAVSLGTSLAPVVHLMGAPLEIGWIAGPLSILWIVGVTNAFNIIDGLDGLSSGLALISSLCMSAVFALVGQPGMAGVSLVLGGALAGFLPYNVHPARLFLGDTGATAIGFCLSVFALRGGSTLSAGFAALLPVFILGLPIADTLIAMLRRTVRRLEDSTGGVFEADRNHIHHRLLALGLEHSRAVLILYGAGLLLAGVALLSIFATARQAAMMVTALFLAGVVGIHRLGYDEFAFIRRGTVLRVYELPAVKRGLFVVFIDIAVSFIAAYVSMALKTDVWNPSQMGDHVLEIATTMAPITIAVFSWRSLYKGSWRVAGLHDLTRVAIAVLIATPIGALAWRAISDTGVSLSVFVIYGIVTLLLTVSIRSSYVILENSKLRASHRGAPILVYGAGRRGVAAVQELFQNQTGGLRPVGFIDDDPEKVGRIVNGIPVLGTSREISRILYTSNAEGVLVSTARIKPHHLDACTTACAPLSLGMFRLDLRVSHMDGQAYEAPGGLQIPAAPILDADAEPDLEIDLRIGCQICPSCKKAAAYRSRARNMFERFRKARSLKRLYRCEECKWRGWLVPVELSPSAAPIDDRRVDFGALDTVVRPSIGPATVSIEALDFK